MFRVGHINKPLLPTLYSALFWARLSACTQNHLLQSAAELERYVARKIRCFP